MKNILIMSVVAAGLVAEKAFALVCPVGTTCNGGAVPEIDGGAAVLAIGLTAGLVALIRERRAKKK